MCTFCHLLERHDLSTQLFAEVNRYLADRSFKLGTRTIVDTTTLHAPSLAKNKCGERGSGMHQVRKSISSASG